MANAIHNESVVRPFTGRTSASNASPKVRTLPIVGNEPSAIDRELAEFEAQERLRLGLESPRPQWIDEMVGREYTRQEREQHGTTVLLAGLSIAHDSFVAASLRGLGYRCERIEVPDNESLRVGKEFGNKSQCNPTYYTVGNLVKFLIGLREKGMSVEQIRNRYVFLTAGACDPCRFGMYATEYRKALRDAGFEGFRVMLFQQTGGLAQATGDTNSGLVMNPPFFIGILKSFAAGDIVNLLGYRTRPYELEKGATDQALERVKARVIRAFETGGSIAWALTIARREFAKIKVDRLRAKPKVSILGEFWAMTTEGDGNYHLQRFLEQEGAELDTQLVSAWVLYLIWQQRNDLENRAKLRGADGSRLGLASKSGVFDLTKQRLELTIAEKAVRTVFRTFAFAAGLSDCELPDMNEIAKAGGTHYNTDLRGGEGHMEVGKLVMNIEHQKAHMTVSVKPFGCMPSAGVSDGVQTRITELYPDAIFCPVETSGDGAVNFYSRVQMFLFKAKARAEQEFSRALEENGLSLEECRAIAERKGAERALHRSPHKACGTAASLVHELAARQTKSRFLSRLFPRAASYAAT